MIKRQLDRPNRLLGKLVAAVFLCSFCGPATAEIIELGERTSTLNGYIHTGPGESIEVSVEPDFYGVFNESVSIGGAQASQFSSLGFDPDEGFLSEIVVRGSGSASNAYPDDYAGTTRFNLYFTSSVLLAYTLHGSATSFGTSGPGGGGSSGNAHVEINAYSGGIADPEVHSIGGRISDAMSLARNGTLEPGSYGFQVSGGAGAGSDIIPLPGYTGLFDFDFTLTLDPIFGDIHWINPAGGIFSFEENWNPEIVPTSGDTTIIDLPGAYTIALTEDAVNDSLQVSGASPAGIAHPRLNLNGYTYHADLAAVQPNGHLEIDGAAGRLHADNLHVAAGGMLSGNGRLRPATNGGAMQLTMDGDLTLGPASDAAPVRQFFLNTDGGPEPAELFAHLAVQGDYTQDATGTMHAVLTPANAVNESALAAGDLPSPPRSADLFVSGEVFLDGKLKATTAPGFVPQHGEKFVIVDSGAIGFAFSDYELPNAFNDLPLKPIHTGSKLQLVTPQKVVLAWGHNLPVGLDLIEVFGHEIANINPLGGEGPLTADSAEALAAYQDNLLAHVGQQFENSGVRGIEFVVGDPEPGAINLYLLEKTAEFGNLLGVAYTGIDRFNAEADGAAAIIINGFQLEDPNDFELDAETITHEVGHLLGLRHIDPPGSISVMDYDTEDGDVELFEDGVFNIKEAPQEGGTVFANTHNPTYHLHRYINGYSHEELEALDIMPGTWDLPGAIDDELEVNLKLRAGGEGDPDAALYDVLVLRSLSDPDQPDILEEFDQITLGELADMTFRITAGEGIGLVAKSMANGVYDIALAPGNPFESEALILYPGLEQIDGFLQMASALPAGFQTLAEIMLAVSVVLDPLAGDFNGDGAVDAADYIVWRKTGGTPEAYDTWRANFGRTTASGATGSASAHAAVPEPSTLALLALGAAMGALVRRRCVAERPHLANAMLSSIENADTK